MEDVAGCLGARTPPTGHISSSQREGGPLPVGQERVARRNHMLNICTKARGWNLIVRTPKLTYLP